MRAFIVLLAVLSAVPVAHAEMDHYLVAQWVENANRFCRYSDGTVLNVGYRLCPLKIRN